MRRASRLDARRPKTAISPSVAPDQVADRVDERRLARAVGAEQAEELARGHLEIEARERQRPVVVALSEVPDREGGRLEGILRGTRRPDPRLHRRVGERANSARGRFPPTCHGGVKRRPPAAAAGAKPASISVGSRPEPIRWLAVDPLDREPQETARSRPPRRGPARPRRTPRRRARRAAAPPATALDEHPGFALAQQHVRARVRLERRPRPLRPSAPRRRGWRGHVAARIR